MPNLIPVALAAAKRDSAHGMQYALRPMIRAVGAMMLVLAVTLIAAGVVFAAAPGTWSPTGSLAAAQPHAILLSSGQVLAVGDPGLSNAELYDPGTGIWRAGARPLFFPTQSLTLLPNGTVLATGAPAFPGSAEIYDPSTNSWRLTGRMKASSGFLTTLLPNGRVLARDAGTSADIFDPNTGTWTLAPTDSTGFVAGPAPSMTLLMNGKVLIVGGMSHTTSALYDPFTNAWSTTGSLNFPRDATTMTVLPNGKVLVAGGICCGEILDLCCDGNPMDSAELYDPATGKWTVTAHMSGVRSGHTATLLPEGKVLVAGGGTAELYDPVTGTWAPTGSMSQNRADFSAALLNTGLVLAVGGFDDAASKSAELYTPPLGAPLPTTCTLSLSGKDAAGHAFIRVAARDFASGLQAVNVLQATNATVLLPKFPLGFREPAVVAATKIDASQPSALKLSVTNRAGKTITCDPVMTTLVGQRHGSSRQVFKSLAQNESHVLLQNDTPGLRRVDLRVNGRHFRMEDLNNGEERTLDVSSGMKAGDHNTVVVTTRGPQDGSAVLVISD